MAVVVRWVYLVVAMVIAGLPAVSAVATYGPDTVRPIEATLFSPGGLSAGHNRLSCSACHRTAIPVGDQSCGQCHEGSASYGKLHGAQLAAHRIAGGNLAAGSGPGCLSCHPQHGVSPVKWSAGEHFGDLFEQELCITCHSADHEKAHGSILSDECGGCHSTQSWRATFEHPVVSAPGGTLSLCVDCHRADWHTRRWSGRAASGRSVDCGLCHEMRR